jgi:hypothetical protein
VNPVVISMLGVAVGLAGFVYAMLRARGADVTAIAVRLAQLETKVDVFWRGVSFDAAAVLHSPHPRFARRDELLERFTAQELTVAEADELRQMMQAVVANHDTESGQRIAASIVLRALAAWYTGDHV